MAQVKMEHMRACHFCRRGVKKWMEAHGINWIDFLNHGIPEEVLIEADDAMAMQPVEYMRKQNVQ